MAAPPSAATKVGAVLASLATAGGLYWYAEPRLTAMFAPPKPAKVYTQEEFSAAPAWEGSRPGWVFKKDQLGLGYYVDK
eukprot:CAMPEP_0194774510 /NCGR_PEP_ID=MMETSP0323_2-20130528/57845_1 /TAXON_ID=2866 ORGANISM="Crypthecodinium cohnii, Strain Seligo" /NCGR_SAMPLE_ID=MMETSP0323_2 /ASSEMBLY_ACC=CAM_ASM_000346 /LENGTH=78 /DNA_ID=CAMNT_0039710077 /DNA_START=97 /DNA_END=333 /DNA_ORIENTATION=-